MNFPLSNAVHMGGVAKNHFWLAATQKKENWCTRTRGIRKMEILKFVADFEVNKS